MRSSIITLIIILAWPALLLAQETTEPAAETAPATEVADPTPAVEAEAPAADAAGEAADLQPAPEAGLSPEDESDQVGVQSKSMWTSYTNYVDTLIAEASKLDIYGNTGQLPKGILSIKYKWNTRQTRSRFYGDGRKGKVIQPMDFGDLWIDLNGTGGGNGHTFMASYGVSDPLDVYIEMGFQTAEVEMKPRFLNRTADVPGSAGWLIESRFGEGIDGFCNALMEMGRPCPKFHYKSKGWEMGDMHAGFSWNFHKTEEFSVSTTPRIWFPTGRIADPNESLFFALGCQVDAGIGAWGLGQTMNIDYRPSWLSKYVVFFEEFTWQYNFPSERPYPTNFRKPTEVGLQLRTLMGPDMETYFPDLSELSGTYTFHQQWSIDGAIGVAFDLKVASVAIQYGFGIVTDPIIHTDSEEFRTMIRAMELVSYSDAQSIGIGVMTPVLLALYVPVYLSFDVEFAQAGRNALIFHDNYTVGGQAFIPINPDF
jgi:hypothetical protein